ncbi:class I SAM-dependent methyltransferase [Pseudonocardia phyllosphaerae]|uniref:class I SAM-dependent methyltransferase n=1 Tax=Pseudonocardia phyllosphaerae TaxID=3390502 RepID=UPI00397827AF
MGGAADRWAQRQAARGIPERILRDAPADPWTHDAADFTPADVPADTPSRHAARALAERAAAWSCAGASVLDVGCGGGDAVFAAAWPDPSPVARVVGVDRQADMLAVFAAAARARDLPYATVQGSWPQAAGEAGRHDVVLCHHVLHNVVDLPPFLDALTAAARPAGGVVVEMLPEHPLAWLDPLWARFHDLHRPASATADDVVAVLGEELGIVPEVRTWERARRLPHDAAWVARRLCLPEDRAGEVAAALGDVTARTTTAVTLVWTGRT